MNIKLFSSICIIIIIVLIVIIDERINKGEEEYIINGENFSDYNWEKKYGNYFNKNKYQNYFINPPFGIDWVKKY